MAQDVRGWVVEPVQEGHLSNMRNAHVVWTLPGHVRGNHVHHKTTETLVVVGPALVCWEEDGMRQDRHVPEGRAWRFVFPPGVPHAIQNTGSSPIVMIAFTDQLHDPVHPDTQRHVLLHPSATAMVSCSSP